MPRWLTRALTRIRNLARTDRVSFTRKAITERGLLRLGLTERDAIALLADIRVAQFDRRLRSRDSGEWLYVFRPTVGATVLYVKVVLRGQCTVISFHPDDGTDDDESD